MPTKRSLSLIRLRKCTDHILVPRTFLEFATLRFVRRLCLSFSEFSSHIGIVTQLVTRRKQVLVTEVQDRFHVCLTCSPSSFKDMDILTFPAPSYKLSFSIQKKNEKLVESSGKGEPVLDFEHRMERRIEEGKRGEVIDCYFANLSRRLEKYKARVEGDDPSTSLEQFLKKRSASAIITDDGTRSAGNPTL